LIKYRHEIEVFQLDWVKDVNESYDKNIGFTKSVLLEDKSGKGHIGAHVNIETTQAFYYVQLDEDTAKANNQSPMDQIPPLIENFQGMKPVNKDLEEPIMSYQFIGEGWMTGGQPFKEGKEPPLKYGDISAMPNREEVLMETRIYLDRPTFSRMFKIKRYENGPGVEKFELFIEDDKGEYKSFKTPPISINKYQ